MKIQEPEEDGTCEELPTHDKNPLVVDQDYNAKASEDKAYQKVKKNDGDTFRDLKRVFESPHVLDDQTNKQLYNHHMREGDRF